MKINPIVYRSFLAAVALWLTALTSHAAPQLEDLVTQAQTALETGKHSGDLEQLAKAKLAIDKAQVLAPNNRWVWYYRGYANYCEATLAQAKKDKPTAEAALNRADEALQKSIDLQPTADALAVHGAVLGSMISVRGPLSGMELGPRSGQDFEQAEELGPDNPRVLMLYGSSLLYTPVEFGGDPQKAVSNFRRAVAIFDREEPKPPLPSWGKAESHLWLGLGLQKLGQNEQARAEFEKTLALDPNYAWVKYVLLPSVKPPAK